VRPHQDPAAPTSIAIGKSTASLERTYRELFNTHFGPDELTILVANGANATAKSSASGQSSPA
jgi:hypothetical protein